MREFLHVDDLADACLFLMDNYSDVGHVNVGTGVDLPIRELAEKIRDVVCPEAELRFDPSKPDGMPRKVLDTSKLNALGWTPSIDLDEGIAIDLRVVLRPDRQRCRAAWAKSRGTSPRDTGQAP